jgi:hypothetical protein
MVRQGRCLFRYIIEQAQRVSQDDLRSKVGNSSFGLAGKNGGALVR